MIHFQAALKPMHNNLSIEKDKAFLTYQTQGTWFEMKKRKQGGNFRSKEKAFFKSANNSNYKGIIHAQNQHKN